MNGDAMYIGKLFSIGAAGLLAAFSARADCPINDQQSIGAMLPGAMTAEMVGGRLTAFNVGDGQFVIVRDSVANKIVGVRKPDGSIIYLPSADKLKSKGSGGKLGRSDLIDPCGGGDSVTVEVESLPPVEVTGASSQEAETWEPVLTPFFDNIIPIAPVVAPPDNPDLTERFKKCKEGKDSCVSKVKNTALIAGAYTCVKVADEIKSKRPRWGIIAILAAAACQVAADALADQGIKRCENEELICRATPS